MRFAGNDGAMRRYPIGQLGPSSLVAAAGGAWRGGNNGVRRQFFQSPSSSAADCVRVCDALPHGGKMKPFKYKPLGGVFIIRGPFHACRASSPVLRVTAVFFSRPFAKC